MMIVLCIVLAAAGAMAVEDTSFDQLSEQEIEELLNSGQSRETGTPTMSYEDFKSRLMNPKYLDSKEDNLLRKAPIKLMAVQDNIIIPPSFDARKKWPKCKSIRHIRNQGNCGSCWAVSVASVMSDRLCIASGQRIQTLLSATDILSCCDECSSKPCDGTTNPAHAWEYIKSHGVCSGGPYNRKGVCKPYVFRPCGYSKKEKMNYGPCYYNRASPKPMCLNKCLQDYGKSYTEDKVYGGYRKLAFDDREIQKEIWKNGPVQATIAVYDNLHNLGHRIYYHKQEIPKMRGKHSVKIIGWGVEKRIDKYNRKINVPYWLVSNSWGADWGDGGFFRIVRGAPKIGCEIEWNVYAGYPKFQ